jgi:hypothetical protein
MTILLDGKDLIDLAEHSIPLFLAEFRDIIESRGASNCPVLYQRERACRSHGNHRRHLKGTSVAPCD